MLGESQWFWEGLPGRANGLGRSKMALRDGQNGIGVGHGFSRAADSQNFSGL